MSTTGVPSKASSPCTSTRWSSMAPMRTMQPDRIGPILRSGAEDTGEWVVRVIARMDGEDVTLGAMEPGQHIDLVAGGEAAGGLGD